MTHFPYKVLLLLLVLASLSLAKQNEKSYDNVFYVILSASTFWFNYRHSLNALIFY